jgi:hypothetical protein
MSSDDDLVNFPTQHQLIKLADAARLPVLRAGGKPCSISTLYRWSSKGVDGAVLRTVVTHRGRMTTPADVDAFIRARSLGQLKKSPQSVSDGSTSAAGQTALRKNAHTEALAKELFPVPKPKTHTQN